MGRIWGRVGRESEGPGAATEAEEVRATAVKTSLHTEDEDGKASTGHIRPGEQNSGAGTDMDTGRGFSETLVKTFREDVAARERAGNELNLNWCAGHERYGAQSVATSENQGVGSHWGRQKGALHP